MYRVSKLWFLCSLAVMSASILGGCSKKSSGGGGGGGSDDVEKEENTSTATGGATGTGTGGATGTGTGGSTGTDTGTGGETAEGARDGYGCLQGVVLDGFTGQRLDIAGLTAPDGVFVLIHGKLIAAKTYTEDALTGEYFICDIPVEDTYPVFAYIDGYLAFESTVMIASTRSVRVDGDQAIAGEVKIPDPIEMANIRLFPTGNTGDIDLKVRVVSNGSGVENATVDLEPQAAVGHFAFSGDFANSANTRLLPMRAVTDGEGYAIFPAASLSLGAKYSVGVLPPTGSNLASASRTDFILGVNGSAISSDKNNFDLTIAIADINNGIRIVSCSKEFQDYNESGAISFIFNRDVQVVDKNLMTATATVASGAVLGSDDPSNIDSEQVTASPSSAKLTLSPKWSGTARPKRPTATKPIDDADNEDRDATILYNLNTVMIKVVGDPDANFMPLSGIAMPAACHSGNTVTNRFWAQIF